MDLSEKLYRALVAPWRTRARARARALPSDGVALADLGARPRILAALVAGEALKVAASEDPGGHGGDTLYVPERIAGLGSTDLARDAYRYRIAYAVTSRALRLSLDVAPTDPLEADLATLLAVRATERRLLAEWPGAAELRERLHRALLDRRPRPRTIRSAADHLEALARMLLGEASSVEAPFATPASLDWLERAMAAAPPDAAAVTEASAALWAELRGIASRGRGVFAPVVLWGRLIPAGDGQDADAASAETHAPALNPRERTIQLDRAVRSRRVVRREREDKPLHHWFEKIDTVEDYGGEKATPEEADDVADLEDALRELDLATVIRTTEAPRSLVRADMQVDPGSVFVSEEADAGGGAPLRYPEWDWRAKAYRADWCTVHEAREAPGDPAANIREARRIVREERARIEAIRAQATRVLFRRRARNRQWEGPEFDLDAVVERHADLRAGHTPPERLYVAARRRPREIAILVLLDASWSTDAYVEGRRVLDVEIASILILAAAFEGLIEEEVAVASFRSRTRSDCRFGVIKAFDEPWRRVHETAPGLGAEGYTRIGPAIRHGVEILARTRARDKLLLLVSDGKPTDYDRYEGRYGVEDVAKAVREARARGIVPHGLAIEKSAKHHLARMLGSGHYAILPHTGELARAMAEVFVRFAAG
ncbi:MAG: VWA domain-containing protein [Myxococcales bacterium]|nr:VWA domain-containing protein [Myxococcales bacterium]